MRKTWQQCIIKKKYLKSNKPFMNNPQPNLIIMWRIINCDNYNNCIIMIAYIIIKSFFWTNSGISPNCCLACKSFDFRCPSHCPMLHTLNMKYYFHSRRYMTFCIYMQISEKLKRCIFFFFEIGCRCGMMWDNIFMFYGEKFILWVFLVSIWIYIIGWI